MGLIALNSICLACIVCFGADAISEILHIAAHLLVCAIKAGRTALMMLNATTDMFVLYFLVFLFLHELG